MAECECLVKCLFFNDRMQNIPAVANMLKDKYCHGNSSECARYMVFKSLGRERVPGDLFPNQVDRAEKIIAEAAA
jgi:hypothetical protein